MKDVIQDIADKVERDRAAIARMKPEDIQAAARELGHPIQPGDIFHVDDVVFKAVAVPDDGRILESGTCTPDHVLIFEPDREDVPTEDELKVVRYWRDEMPEIRGMTISVVRLDGTLVVIPPDGVAEPEPVSEADEVLQRLQERLERDAERIKAGEFINPYIQMDDSDLIRAVVDDLARQVADMRPRRTALERRLYGVPRCGLGPGDAADPWTEIHNTIATMHGRIERQDKIITALLKHCDLKLEDVDALYGQVIGR